MSRNVRAVLQRESESREDAQSAAADRARADAARAEARKHEAQAEKLQAQFAAAVADANAARSEVLHLREALVLQREDAASRARVQLAQAEFAAAERRKTEDERARASELADDLAGDSQVQLEPSRAGQLSSSEEAIGRRAAAAFRLAGRNRRDAVSTTVVFEAPKDPVRALDAALAAGDAAELAALEALLEGRRGDALVSRRPFSCSSSRRGLAREEPSTRPIKRRLVASTKGATGHLLGAAGALEACFAVLALRDCLAPATAHLAAPLPTSERINLVAEATRRDLRVALSTSSGFGGTNAALVFSRTDVSGDLGVEARVSVL